MVQQSASPTPPRRSSRKVKPNLDPNFEYVQSRLNQLDRELAATGISPHVSTPPNLGSLPLATSSDLPVPSPLPSAMSAEIPLAELRTAGH